MKKKNADQEVKQMGILRDGKIVSYILGNNEIPPPLPKDEKYYVFRMAISLVDKMRFNEKLSKKIINQPFPNFTMVAIDRDSAKKIMSETIDNVFNAYENNIDPKKWVYGKIDEEKAVEITMPKKVKRS